MTGDLKKAIMKKVLASAWLFITTIAAHAQSKDTLFVYGPGGPQAPMEECAKLCTNQTGIPVKVIAGPETKWIDQAKRNADVIFAAQNTCLINSPCNIRV